MLDPTVLAAAQYVLETVNPSDIVERAPDDLIQEAFIAGARWQGSCARGRMAFSPAPQSMTVEPDQREWR